jgi:hypothetical protein
MVKRKYMDFSNVETQNHFLTSEEFPEGPFGTQRHKDKPVSNKDTPWKDDQQFISGFTYEYRTFHEGLPRQFPGAHPTHDDPKQEKVPPYENYTPD